MFHLGKNHAPNGGTASCRSAVFFGLEEEGRGLGEEERGRKRMGTGLGGLERTLRGRKRTERTDDFEEDENGT